MNDDNKNNEKKPTNLELFKSYAKTKDIKTRNELVSRNQPLVTYIFKKYYSSGRIPEETRKELLQEGTIGLLSAIEGFNPELGFKFSTYSSWWIRQAINNYLINVNPIIRVPGHVKAAQNKLFKELKLRKEDMKNLLEMNPDDFDISKKMLGSIDSAIKSKQVTSLSTPISIGSDGRDGNDCTLEDIISSDGLEGSCTEINNRREHELDKTLMFGVVKQALKSMPEKKRLILLLRYGVIKEKDIKNRK